MGKLSTSFFDINSSVFIGCNNLPLDRLLVLIKKTGKYIVSVVTIFCTDKRTCFGRKSYLSLTLLHNRHKFLTNRNIACFHFGAYHIYMRVILAFSPKMAPISKKHGKQGMEPPLPPTTNTKSRQNFWSSCRIPVAGGSRLVEFFDTNL